MADPGTGPTTQIALKVTFDLNTPDGKRKVHFGLEKDVVGTDIVWKIDFTLFERTDTTAPFGDAIVSLSVQVDPTLNARADQAAKGLTPSQTAHATGPAAEAAKAANDGELPQEVADGAVQDTLEQ
jgi:hypothetical protein